MDQTGKVSLSRQTKILGLDLQKWTIFEPDTSRICVQWMIFRGDTGTQMGEIALMLCKGPHSRHRAPSSQNSQVSTPYKAPGIKMLPE